MERTLVYNKKRQQREFRMPHGVVSLTKGDNWLSQDDLVFLKENSPGFQHFVEKKIFEIKDEKRPESAKEQEQRESMIKRATKAARSMFPGANKATPAADAPVMIDTSASVAEFDKAIAESLSKALNDFQEKAKLLSAQLSVEALNDFQTKINESTESFISNNLGALKASLLVPAQAQQKDFEKSILEAQVSAENDFAANIKQDSADAEKKFIKALQKAQK